MSTDQETLATTPTTTIPWLGGEFLDLLVRERAFLAMLGIGFLVAGLTWPVPHVAMWVGFAFAAYSAIANDSIQTLGTFLASNHHRPWWVLWLFAAGIFLAVMTFGWATNDGDVTYARLAAKGFETAPTNFAFLQVAAPLFLAIVTRLRMPVSTTFLLLTSFSTSTSGVGAVLQKSLTGYVVAFAVALVVWAVAGRLMDGAFRGRPHKGWTAAQWLTTGALWSVWLMQDAANIAVYLPRKLSTLEYGVFAGTIVVGLGLLFFLRGDRIQQVVTEKSDVVDVRYATVIDGVYALVLFWFTVVSNTPMSTTWVFVGLLAGREIGVNLFRPNGRRRSAGHVARLVGRDLLFVTLGLALSLLIAIAVNPQLGNDLFGVQLTVGAAK